LPLEKFLRSIIYRLPHTCDRINRKKVKMHLLQRHEVKFFLFGISRAHVSRIWEDNFLVPQKCRKRRVKSIIALPLHVKSSCNYDAANTISHSHTYHFTTYCPYLLSLNGDKTLLTRSMLIDPLATRKHHFFYRFANCECKSRAFLGLLYLGVRLHFRNERIVNYSLTV